MRTLQRKLRYELTCSQIRELEIRREIPSIAILCYARNGFAELSRQSIDVADNASDVLPVQEEVAYHGVRYSRRSKCAVMRANINSELSARDSLNVCRSFRRDKRSRFVLILFQVGVVHAQSNFQPFNSNELHLGVGFLGTL